MRAVTVAALALAMASPATALDAENLRWLSGCWMGVQTRSDIEEHWMEPKGGAMLGMSRTVQGGRLVDWEHLAIRPVNGVLAYVAKPSRQPEATFPLKSSTASEAVFENPTHDFPQRIIYRRTTGGMTATIEGVQGGADPVEVSRTFTFERCR